LESQLTHEVNALLKVRRSRTARVVLFQPFAFRRAKQRPDQVASIAAIFVVDEAAGEAEGADRVAVEVPGTTGFPFDLAVAAFRSAPTSPRHVVQAASGSSAFTRAVFSGSPSTKSGLPAGLRPLQQVHERREQQDDVRLL
jgi:hypothetical protein